MHQMAFFSELSPKIQMQQYATKVMAKADNNETIPFSTAVSKSITNYVNI